MEGQGSANSPLPEALEFEGRFMSSCPISDNTFWWHHEQSSPEQQLPDFIPIHNYASASHQSIVRQAGWNAERLNSGQPSSISIKYGSGYSQEMEFQNTLSEVGSGSNNLPYQPTIGTYQGNSNGNSTRSSSSAHTSMNFLRTGIVLREENNRSASAVVTTHPSDKRKSPEECWGESVVMSSKRSVQSACSSDSHAAASSHIPCGGLSMPSSSANIYGLGSLETLSSGTVPPPRSSFFDIPPQPWAARSDQNFGQISPLRTNTSIQGSVPVNFALSGNVVSQNSDNIVQRPRLVIPPPQAVGDGSNVQNHLMTVHCPVASQQVVDYAAHHNGSRNMANNSSGPDISMDTRMEEMRFRNSTQSFQFPVIAPSVGSSNLAHITMDLRTSGGDASIPVNPNLGPPDPNPNLPVPTPNLISNSYRRRRLELIRQALLDVDSYSGAATISPPEVHLGITPETRQRLISRARHLITTMYRGGRDISLFEVGVNARQSLISALANIHDQHRDMRLDVDNMSYEELLELGERIGDVKTGLSEETIMDSLKCTKYAFNMKFNQHNAGPCSICREEYAEGEDLGTLDCGHEYHTNCIKQWLVLKNSCPICKAAASSSSK